MMFVLNRALSIRRAIRLVAGPAAVEASGATETVRLAAFNIAHGRGEHRPIWDWGDPQEVSERVGRVGRLVRDLQVDVAVLNEVDFSSIRSGHVDQAELLAKTSGLGHRCEQQNIDMAIPFVRNRYGNLVLSRFEILEARRVSLPGYALWETLLGGKKEGVLCTLAIEKGCSISVFAVHLEHRSEEVRLRSAEVIAATRAGAVLPLVAIGDFNSTLTTAPGASLTRSGDTALSWLLERGGFRTAPWPEVGPKDLTFPADSPRAAIDWVLVPPEWKIVSQRVVHVHLSDHLPVVMDVRIASIVQQPGRIGLGGGGAG